MSMFGLGYPKKDNLKIESVKIASLRPAEYNPRKWDKEAFEQLSESIKRFGLVDPLLVNSAQGRENIVIGGHFRLAVAKELGFEEIPVVYLNISDPEKEKELNLRLNRNVGEFDFDLLKEFDLNLLLEVGFNDTDLSGIWDDVLEVNDDGFDVDKELEKIVTPTTQLGDFFALGEHRLICGDSSDPEVVKKLAGDDRALMVYCDSPYNIQLNYAKGFGNQNKYGGGYKDDLPPEEYKAFLKKTMENALAVSEKDTHVFYWNDQNHIGLIQELFDEIGIKNQRVCLWIKNNFNATPKIAFNKAYEPCIYGTRGTPFLSDGVRNLSEIMNKDIDSGNRTADDILDYFDIWLVKRLASNEYEHPTQKPVTLHEKPLRRCTLIGDTVLDLFGGSGSTLIACEQMKRRALLVEIDPIFCDLIIKRYEQLTGKQARKLN